MISTTINLLNAAQWKAWGHEPTFALGHSIGEVAAAAAAGLLTTEEAMRTAHKLGQVSGYALSCVLRCNIISCVSPCSLSVFFLLRGLIALTGRGCCRWRLVWTARCCIRP